MEKEIVKFEDLNISENIKKALKDIGYTEMTEIQKQAIPYILEGKDVIGQSQTGTGKTASFGLPMIEKIDSKFKKTQSIILCPTRELAVQVTQELRKFLKYQDNIKCMAIYGGESIERQILGLKKGVQIIVGTPGRVMDHMRRRTIKLDNVKMVILDEADEMLNMGFEEDIETILKDVPQDRQTILFSATMNKRILGIAKKYLTKPKNIKIQAEELTVEKIRQEAIEVKANMKDEATCRIIDVVEKTNETPSSAAKETAEILPQRVYSSNWSKSSEKEEKLSSLPKKKIFESDLPNIEERQKPKNVPLKDKPIKIVIRYDEV